jgi:methyl-accepting chemotaxis protein
MKNTPGKQGLGTLLFFIAIFGIIFSVLGIATTWYFKPRVQDIIITIVDSIDQILINTEGGLVVLDSALESAIGNLDTISISLTNLNTTVDSISDSLNSSADLIGGDLRLTIIDTQTALTSAAASAGLVDNTLRFIAAIPLLGADYRPEVPLSVSLEQVSESLDDIPDAFLEIEQYIRETDDGMVSLKADISELASEIDEYEQDLIDAKTILSDYDLIIDDLREQLSNIRQQTALFLMIGSIFLSGGFFLLGIAQINTLQQAIDYRKGEQVTVNLAELQREQ